MAMAMGIVIAWTASSNAYAAHERPAGLAALIAERSDPQLSHS